MDVSPIPHRAGLLALLILAANPAPTHAAIYTVGAPGGGCTHTTIQAAVNAAAANPGADTVRITRTQAYTAQQIVVNTTQDINIVGGFATCASTASDGTQTIVSGAGGDTLPVFDLRMPQDATIKFRLLRITAGDQDGSGSGGGINYIGVGLVELIETTVSNNVAAYGGGIYFEGTSDDAELKISNDVLISGNEATVSGGGIYLYGASLTMTAPGSSIAFNSAVQFGGGLMQLCSARNTNALVGSSGYAGLAAIEGNEAANGGGVAAVCNENGNIRSIFRLETQNAATPARIAHNFASQYGGGLFLQPFNGINDAGDTLASIIDGELDGNVAPDAAAALVGSDTNVGFPRGAYLLVSGGRVRDHVTSTSASVPTNGAVFVVRAGADLTVRRVHVSDNDSGPMLHARNPRFLTIADSLIESNIVRGPLLEVFEPSAQFDVVGNTITANAMSNSGPSPSPVIFAQHAAHLRRMLIWQPGRVTLDVGAPDVDDVLASEIASLPPGGTYAIDAPRFLDAERRDYRLQAASPAVDFSSIIDGFDLAGTPRNIDIARVIDLDGRGDLGAFERDSLGNLVRNPGFADDLRLWAIGTPGVVATRTDAGVSSNGAVTLSMQAAPGGEFTGFVQCVRMPGPGAWRLSGFAYGAGADPFTRDIPSIRWRLIHNTGDESCGGVTDAEGSIAFANPATFAQGNAIIDIPADQWTPYTAIEVQLRGREGSVNINATTTVHFDGIVIEATDAVVTSIFSDGFE